MSRALRVGFLLSGLVHVAVVAAFSLSPRVPLPASEQPRPLTLRMAVFEPPPPAPVTAPAPQPPAKMESEPKPVAEAEALKPPAPEPVKAARPATKPPPRLAARPVARKPVQRPLNPKATKTNRPKPAARVVDRPAPEERPPSRPDSTPTPVTVAKAELEPPRPAAPVIDLQAQQHYLAELAARINRKKYYPRASRRRGEEGRVVVGFVIQKTGELTDLVVRESSGSWQLDEAALKTVRRVSPFRPIPAAVGREQWSISVPIAFSLRG